MSGTQAAQDEPEMAPVLIFLRVEENLLFKEVLGLWGETDKVRILTTDTVENTVQAAQGAERAIVACILSKPSHLKDFAQIATPLRERILRGTIEIALMSQLAHPNVHKVLKSLGCRELLHPSIKSKPLKIRLQKQLELLGTQSRQRTSKASTENPQASGGTEKPHQPIPNYKSGEVKVIDALNLEDDCWLTDPAATRRVRGMWMVTLIGPGGTAGRWVKARISTSISGGAKEVWEWLPHHPTTDLFVKNGKWIFFGRQPELSDMRWTMISKKPEFRYLPHDNENLPLHRFSLDPNGNLLLPKNSASAEAKVPAIKASFEFSIVLKKEPEKKVADFVDYCEKNKGRFTPDYKVELDPKKGKELELELEAPDPGKLLEITQKQALSKEFDYSDSKPPEEHEGPCDELARAPVGSYLKQGFGKKKKIDPKELDYLHSVDKKLRPKHGLFIPVEDPADQASYLEESLMDDSSVILWTPRQAFRQNSKLANETKEDGVLVVRYPEGHDADSLIETFTQLKAELVYFNLNLNRSSLFFMQETKSLDFRNNGIGVRNPASLFEVQRRNHFRLQFKGPNPFRVQIGVLEQNAVEDEKRIFMAVNLGAGGLCIQSSLNAKRKFNVGDVLPNVVFEIYDREVRCSGVVRWNSGGFFGIQFLKIEPEEFDAIRLYVMEESSEYFKRSVVPIVP